jgi:rRNA maturation endonuclease Nob1
LSFVILFLLLAIVIAFIAYPLLRREAYAVTATSDDLDNLATRKDSLYSMLKELEFDYDMGNLSPEDHRVLEEKYKRKAAATLREIDALSAARRGRRKQVVEKPMTEDEIEDEVRRLRRQKRTCSHCGAAVSPGDRFCPQCGQRQTQPVCPQCQSPYKPGDRFCSNCGSAVMKGS